MLNSICTIASPSHTPYFTHVALLRSERYRGGTDFADHVDDDVDNRYVLTVIGKLRPGPSSFQVLLSHPNQFYPIHSPDVH